MALEHFVLVVVRVLRGPSQADESAKKLRKLVHCQWCEARAFLKQGNMADGLWPFLTDESNECLQVFLRT